MLYLEAMRATCRVPSLATYTMREYQLLVVAVNSEVPSNIIQNNGKAIARAPTGRTPY